MNSKEINHACGLQPRLLRKSRDLRDQAEYANKSKDGCSRMAVRLLAEAERLETTARELAAAIDEQLGLGR